MTIFCFGFVFSVNFFYSISIVWFPTLSLIRSKTLLDPKLKIVTRCLTAFFILRWDTVTLSCHLHRLNVYFLHLLEVALPIELGIVINVSKRTMRDRHLQSRSVRFCLHLLLLKLMETFSWMREYLGLRVIVNHRWSDAISVFTNIAGSIFFSYTDC